MRSGNGFQVPNKTGGMEWVAPEDYFQWENLPSESDAYLFPVQSKKYLESIRFKKPKL